MYPKLASVVVDLIIKWLTNEKEIFFDVYEETEKLEFSKLNSFFQNLIQSKTRLLLQLDSFLNIQKSTLKYLLYQPKLNISEPELFDACLRWSRAECGRNGIVDPRPDELRETFGDLVFLIRIFSFTTKTFIDGPGESEIFTNDELLEVILHLESNKRLMNSFVPKFNPKARSFEEAKWTEIFSYFPNSHGFETFCDVESKIVFSFNEVVHLQGFRIERTKCDYPEIKRLTVEQDSKLLFSLNEISFVGKTYELVFDLGFISDESLTIQLTLHCDCLTIVKAWAGSTSVVTERRNSASCQYQMDEIPSCVNSVSLLLS